MPDPPPEVPSVTPLASVPLPSTGVRGREQRGPVCDALPSEGDGQSDPVAAQLCGERRGGHRGADQPDPVCPAPPWVPWGCVAHGICCLLGPPVCLEAGGPWARGCPSLCPHFPTWIVGAIRSLPLQRRERGMRRCRCRARGLRAGPACTGDARARGVKTVSESLTGGPHPCTSHLGCSLGLFYDLPRFRNLEVNSGNYVVAITGEASMSRQ